jgi:hypothetical protein
VAPYAAAVSLPGITQAQLLANMNGITSSYLADLAFLMGASAGSLTVGSARLLLLQEEEGAAPACAPLQPGASATLSFAAALTAAQAAALQLLFLGGSSSSSSASSATGDPFEATNALLQQCCDPEGASACPTLNAASAAAGGSIVGVTASSPLLPQPAPDSAWVAALVLAPLACLAAVLLLAWKGQQLAQGCWAASAAGSPAPAAGYENAAGSGAPHPQGAQLELRAYAAV